MSNAPIEILGVDVGSKRIGIARINSIARIAHPVQTVAMSDTAATEIKKIAEREGSDLVVVGIPTTVSGVDSEQTLYCREFAATLEEHGLQVVLQDETLSSRQAEQIQERKTYAKNALGQVPGLDEIAATVIVSDYLNTHIS